MDAKKQKPKGLSDKELVRKYESGKIDMKKAVGKMLNGKSGNSLSKPSKHR